MESEGRSVKSGEWRVESAEGRVEIGEWRLETGERRAEARATERRERMVGCARVRSTIRKNPRPNRESTQVTSY